MKIFIDTANIKEIKEGFEMGVISGVTTNPSLIAKEKCDFVEVIQKITSIVDGPISAEIDPTISNAKDMVIEGEKIAKIHKNIVVKLPTTSEGLKACKELTQLGIKTNMTLIFSVPQALLAVNAGATYVSPFVGRLDDISMNGIQLVKDIAEVFSIYKIKTKIIAASIRNTTHIIECAKVGADIMTIPFSLLKAMVYHPLTDQGIEKFKKDSLLSFEKHEEV